MVEKRMKYKVKKERINDALWELHDFNINVASREIFLHGWHNSEWNENLEPEVEYRMATKFIKNLAFLNNQSDDNILIHQQTCGGDWDHGMAIHDAIAASVAPTTMLCYAHSRSMSSLTLQAATTRVLMPDCFFMMHHGSAGGEDTVRGMLTFAEQIAKDKSRMMEVYVWRCAGSEAFKDMSERQIENFLEKKLQLKQEWFMNAEEAVHYGFADGVFGDKGFDSIDKIRRKR